MTVRAKARSSYLPLAVLGVVVIGGISGWETWQLFRARNWVETPAAIRTGGTYYQLGRGGGNRHWWRYTYEWEGQAYASEQVQIGLLGSVPPPPRVGASLTCFVNPANPAEACVYRSWTWGLSFFWSMTLLCALLPWLETLRAHPVISLPLESWRNRRQRDKADGDAASINSSKSPPS